MQSYKGAPIADALYTFPETIPTLTKCNQIIDYTFTLISYKDLTGVALASSSSTLLFYDGCTDSPCRSLTFDVTRSGEIIFTVKPVDSAG
jgi:hypothetical protein